MRAFERMDAHAAAGAPGQARAQLRERPQREAPGRAALRAEDERRKALGIQLERTLRRRGYAAFGFGELGPQRLARTARLDQLARQRRAGEEPAEPLEQRVAHTNLVTPGIAIAGDSIEVHS